ncbi:hypothetical protein AVEN_268419-1 [Araneus ventricosus]|uniref:Uncharacterized protein n=1 Tax=Araneus ventricosus TaxID=182803 RepID=A0A4Y2DTC4_ARAVE|nr:hypothetical protein AVEN_268419-1 [Araneus ventricosus]
MVVVLRYVLSNRQPVESPPGYDAKSIAECIQPSLEKLVAKTEKSISQSYDGTNLMSVQHAGVKAFIQRAYKNAKSGMALEFARRGGPICPTGGTNVMKLV